MKIKDIVNRDIVNLENCESEPIHIPGSIQQNGFLLGLTPSHTIQFCSENITAYIHLLPQDILGKHFEDVFTHEKGQCFNNYLAHHKADFPRPFVCNYDGVIFSTSVHKNDDGLWILEFEPQREANPEITDLYLQTRAFVAAMENTQSLQRLCHSVANEVRTITGYDRVMIYRFDKEYNGEVYAESKRDDLEPFLGLHYPHTDIPVQARQLYLRNLLRMIVDVNGIPVPVLTPDGPAANNKSLDLSISLLRSPSPIHIEYLKNMGVGATLTISLIHNKKLWGLIACHHYSPRNIDYNARLSALLQGHFLTSQIDVRNVAQEHELTKTLDEKLQQFLKHLTDTSEISDIVALPQLLQLANADGVAIFYNNTVHKSGNTPASKEIELLAQWLAEKDYTEFVTSKLAGTYPRANEIAHSTAGIFYYPFKKNNHSCILWFRPEIETTITWAGDPEKAIIKDINGLSPRKSFDLWKQVVKNQSREWLQPEVSTITHCAYTLQKQFLYTELIKEQESQRKLTEKLKAVNDELSSINWISTHDLKEPLRKIQIFSSKLLHQSSHQISKPLAHNIERINKSALRMQNLLNDILHYSRIANYEDKCKTTDLNTILAQSLVEFEDVMENQKTIIMADKLPVISGIPFQLRQLFINLISNAIKFSKPGVPLQLTITCKTAFSDTSGSNAAAGAKEFYNITFQDNGIGFDSKYESIIFKVFQRLNSIADFEGTGIGLAICKKIMENHKGFITAEGEHNAGAKFSLYFPKE